MDRRLPLAGLLLVSLLAGGCVFPPCEWRGTCPSPPSADPLAWLNQDDRTVDLWVDGVHRNATFPHVEPASGITVAFHPTVTRDLEVEGVLSITTTDGKPHVVGVGRAGWNVGILLSGATPQPVQARFHWSGFSLVPERPPCEGTARLVLEEWGRRWQGVDLQGLVGTRGANFTMGPPLDPLHLVLRRSADPSVAPALTFSAATCEEGSFRLAATVSEGFANATFRVMDARGNLTRLPGALFVNQTTDIGFGAVLDVPGGVAGDVQATAWGVEASARFEDLARLGLDVASKRPWLRLTAGFERPPPEPPEPGILPLPQAPRAGHSEGGTLSVEFHRGVSLALAAREEEGRVRFEALGWESKGVPYDGCERVFRDSLILCASHPGTHDLGAQSRPP